MSKLAKLLNSPEWAANLAKVANLRPLAKEDSQDSQLSQGWGSETRLTEGLETRLRLMASRWSYAPEELSEVLDLASRDPVKWQLAVALDEQLCERLKGGEQ